jgi:PKD repeat protein
LVGETKETGFPILHESHGVGSLIFGTDGSLMATCGDGASYNAVDTGGTNGGSYGPQALADGIIKVKENVGALRAQLIDSHSGKLIRIDPNTGDGLPTNPFYDKAAPRAAKSRVWAMGLRNPCRATLRPESGSHKIEDGDPGAVYIGDVGWNAWEELNVCTGPAQNFGWPLYEGLTSQSGYTTPNIQNQDAPNPLFGGSCTQQYFYFKNLLKQDTLEADPFFANPCNGGVEIPDTIPKFIHRRPSIDWGRPSGPARTGIYNGNNAAVINVGAAGSPVTGVQFGGNCSIGGVWYTGTSYPAQYQNKWFHSDYGHDWIRVFTFDDNNKPTAVQSFASNTGELVGMAAHPITGDIYYARWNQVFKISYTPSGNQPPIAVATADVTYGSSPLTVQFNGSGSSDPNNQVLQYLWTFGDGQTSNQANPSHTFNVPSGEPTQFNVTLKVTDPGSLSSTTTLIISVNNTPPLATIVSPVDGSKYSMSQNTIYNLVSSTVDAEHDGSELTCQWDVVLHHNAHTHPETPDLNCTSTMTATPVGCDGNLYFYRVTLTITDDAGLSGTDSVDIYPNCEGNEFPTAVDDQAVVLQGGGAQIGILANDTDSDGKLDPGTIAIIEAPLFGEIAVDGATGVVTYSHDGLATDPDDFAYTVNDMAGGTSNIAQVTIDITPVDLGDINGDGDVDVDDLLMVINAWGPCFAPPATCPADIAPSGGDGIVDVDDLLMVVNHWG